MKLDKKKNLAAEVLKIGKNRIIFDKDSLSEIKEAITKQDIKDLYSQGIIKIKDKKGRRKKEKRKTKKRGGKKKKRIKSRKQEYVKVTRKLRNYISELKKQGKIDNEDYKRLRKEIKARQYRSKAQLKESNPLKITF